MKYYMHFPVDYFLERRYRFASLAHRRACSRDDPEDGARRGVLRQRLITAVPGGTGPRQPGTTTRTRGARCNRAGANAGEGSAGPEPKIATVERRELGVPRHGTQGASLGAWPAASRAGHGCPSSRTSLGARPPLERGGAKPKSKTRAQKTRRGNEMGCLKSESDRCRRHVEPAHARDLAARSVDARNRRFDRFERDRHVEGIGVNERSFVAHDRHVPVPEQKVAAPQLRVLRKRAAERLFLHVAVARARDAASVKRDLHEA